MLEQLQSPEATVEVLPVSPERGVPHGTPRPRREAAAGAEEQVGAPEGPGEPRRSPAQSPLQAAPEPRPGVGRPPGRTPHGRAAPAEPRGVP